MLYHAMLHHAMLYHAALYHAMPVLCHAVLCHAMLRHATPCHAMLTLLLMCTDDSDDEQEATERMPSSRISTSMVKQATAHLHRHGRYYITLT